MAPFIPISTFVLGTIIGLITMLFILRRRQQSVLALQQASKLDIAMLEERLRAKNRDVIVEVSQIYHLDEVIDGLQKTVKLLTADKASLEVLRLQSDVVPQNEPDDCDTHAMTNEQSTYLISRDF